MFVLGTEFIHFRGIIINLPFEGIRSSPSPWIRFCKMQFIYGVELFAA
jgi:hypothetical protein